MPARASSPQRGQKVAENSVHSRHSRNGFFGDQQCAVRLQTVLSFNTIHDRVSRCETGSLRHATWLGDAIATRAGLDIHSPGFAKDLWHAAQEGYSLDPVIGRRKFGPHHVVLKTSLSNIRMTTFFAGESEVKIVDPSRVSVVEAVGCEVEFLRPTG